MECGDVSKKPDAGGVAADNTVLPRTGRLNYPGALHHVMVRGVARGKIFGDDRDR